MILLILRNSFTEVCILLLQAVFSFLVHFISSTYLVGPEHFRIHPKGKGVQCIKKGGISANSIICKYLGEVYPPWLWFEKQDLLKIKLHELEMDHNLPEFYNIILERPITSPGGYDVLFIDPIFRGNFGSRLSHSCDPNCATTTITVRDKLAIVLYEFIRSFIPRVAVRDIAYGEELTFDYSCVSESQEEFEKATCLCGSAVCRGSFLYYSDRHSFTQVLLKYNGFLRRTSTLLEVCSDSLTISEMEFLQNRGIKGCILEGAPQWLCKWCVKAIQYIDFEVEALPREIVNLTDSKNRRLFRDINAAIVVIE